MHSSNNRRNHDFQIAYFLAGSCHTPDGAYSLLCDLKEERVLALNNVKASKLREQAKRLRAERRMKSEDEAERLEGEADIAELEAFEEVTARNIAAAEAELATIERCIALVQPLRKFAHLPDAEAHEATQADEWKLELISRAENSLLTTGTIPTDQFATMRMHPAFLTEILPAVDQIRNALTSPDNIPKLLAKEKSFDLLLMLSHTTQES